MSLEDWLANQPSRCRGCGYDRKRQGCRCADVAPTDEWALFKQALRESVDDNGLIHQSAMRSRIRGRIEPKHIGQMWRRARSEGLVRDTGEREQSDDHEGRNADKLDRIYAMGRAA